MNWTILLAALPWKEIITVIWSHTLPVLEKKVSDSESIWDDVMLDALKVIVGRFIEVEETPKQICE